MRYSWIHHACTIILFSQTTLTQLHYRMSDHLEKHYSIERLEVGDIYPCDLSKSTNSNVIRIFFISLKKRMLPKVSICLQLRDT